MTTSVGLSPSPILQFFNNQGQPAAGGSVLTQVGGINTATYQDSAGTTPLPNPIPLNSRGEVSNASGVSSQLFLIAGTTYIFTLFDANGNQLNQATAVASSLQSSNNLSDVGNAATALSNIGGVSQSGAQAQTFTAYTTAGTSTAYTLTPSPAIAAYTANIEFDVKFHVACGASPTLTISGLATPPNLVKQNGDGTFSNLVANDIPINWKSKVVLVSSTQALVRSLPQILRHGNVRFENVSPFATNVQLYAFNGDGLLVKSATGWEMIALTTTGLTANITSCNLNGVAAQALSNGTLYYAYVAFIGGTAQLDFSTTGHTPDAASGVEVKSGDATRTLVGMLYVGNGSGGTTSGSIAGTQKNQLVCSWFNKIYSVLYVSVNAAGIVSTSYAEMNSTNRINFVAFPDEDSFASASATITNNGAAGTVSYFGIGLDVTNTYSGQDSQYQQSTTNYAMTISPVPFIGGIGEGFHFLAAVAKVSTGTATYSNSAMQLYMPS